MGVWRCLVRQHGKHWAFEAKGRTDHAFCSCWKINKESPRIFWILRGPITATIVVGNVRYSPTVEECIFLSLLPKLTPGVRQVPRRKRPSERRVYTMNFRHRDRTVRGWRVKFVRPGREVWNLRWKNFRCFQIVPMKRTTFDWFEWFNNHIKIYSASCDVIMSLTKIFLTQLRDLASIDNDLLLHGIRYFTTTKCHPYPYALFLHERIFFAFFSRFWMKNGVLSHVLICWRKRINKATFNEQKNGMEIRTGKKSGAPTPTYERSSRLARCSSTFQPWRSTWWQKETKSNSSALEVRGRHGGHPRLKYPDNLFHVCVVFGPIMRLWLRNSSFCRWTSCFLSTSSG